MSLAHWVAVVGLLCSMPALLLFYKNRGRYAHLAVLVTGVVISGAWFIYDGADNPLYIIIIGWMLSVLGTCFYHCFIIRSMQKCLNKIAK